MELSKEELKELGIEVWDYELAVGKDNADPRTYEKKFSIDDITKALQGVHNPTFDVQKMLVKLQRKENKDVWKEAYYNMYHGMHPLITTMDSEQLVLWNKLREKTDHLLVKSDKTK